MELDVARLVLAILGGVGVVNGLTLWALKKLLDWQQAQATATLKRYAEEISGRATKQDARIDGIADQVAQMRRELPETYVRRDDYVNSIGRIEQKMDAIWQFLRDNMLRMRSPGEK